MSLNKIILVFCVIILGGCSGMQDDSSCTMIDGIQGCSSMNDVHNMVNNGDISADNYGNVYRNYPMESDGEKKQSGKTINVNSLAAGTVNESPKPSTPMRIGERIIEMTIFPFLDEDESYHDTAGISILYTKPRWSKPSISKVVQSEVD
ncbi:type IV conjugative transfer system lipoprotein TraV [Vibrio furnissii]|uniref:type IV conjugative transfer system lipoprotein TraV n=1 Tax=Vibrio furnissii TaxID=29494 RepID=UPI001C9CF6C3|nr:type IV conjugative transfer system lipoprotein TraV [Vibrio furnissii]MBY7933081.1 type IV conjugative transfer system lipoprotein TraV [Vibrio fluvialis]MCG6268460.1 type IV conjugative transfer system lipoprotein TraV [Vibrio furnissii]